MTDEQEYGLYKSLIFWLGLIFLSVVLTVAAYNIADRVGPVRPYVHPAYSWPDGTPSKP